MPCIQRSSSTPFAIVSATFGADQTVRIYLVRTKGVACGNVLRTAGKTAGAPDPLDASKLSEGFSRGLKDLTIGEVDDKTPS